MRLSSTAAVGSGSPAVGESKHGAEVVDYGLKAAGSKPAASLLVDHLPRREVLGQVTPRGAATDEPSKAIQDVAEIVHSLAGVLGKQAKVGEDELPFRVSNIAGVGSVSDHTLKYVPQWTTVHNTL